MLKKLIRLLSKDKLSGHKTDTPKAVLPPSTVAQNLPRTAKEIKDAGDKSLNANKPGEAELYYKQSLEIDPNQAEVHNSLGITLYYLHRLEEAIASYDRAIAINPDYADVYINRGVALNDLKRADEAIASYDRAIAINPDYAFAYNNRGVVLNSLKRADEALASYDRAIAINPDYSSAYNNRGVVLSDLKRVDEALASYNRAIALKPDYAEAYNNRGLLFYDLKRLNEALNSYDRAIELNPDYAEAYYNRGIVLNDLKRLDEALASYGRAIAINPNHAGAYYNRGIILNDLKRLDEALASYDRAVALMPDHDFLYGYWLNAKMKLCNWRNYDQQVKQLASKIERNERASQPFVVLTQSNSRLLQKKAAEIYVQSLCPANDTLPPAPKLPKHDKIRIGYFSADFRNHPVSFLTAELFQMHDRSKFELIAFYFGPDTKDEMRIRVAAAFDQFIDVRQRSDQEIALMARNLEIDIAVDLGGYTAESRAGIFALRAAPLQVSYLGYLGTIGAEYMDYLIADPVIVPQTHQKDYSEKIIYLPSYQVNDTKRSIANKVFSRKELGLPPTGFVFCCFNNNYKITPHIFDSWMRILQQVAGSVLWLLGDNATTEANLRAEATRRGVDAQRLIFAKRLPLPEYLARYRIADLFLDTSPYNAGTTASDALWAGLPVLTYLGETFAGRMAASLLNAIHLPELVANTLEEYEMLAVTLATQPEKHMKIKQKLAENRLTTPLFNTQQFTHSIEAAYTQIYARYQADLMPDHITVDVS